MKVSYWCGKFECFQVKNRENSLDRPLFRMHTYMAAEELLSPVYQELLQGGAIEILPVRVQPQPGLAFLSWDQLGHSLFSDTRQMLGKYSKYHGLCTGSIII